MFRCNPRSGVVYLRGSGYAASSNQRVKQEGPSPPEVELPRGGVSLLELLVFIVLVQLCFFTVTNALVWSMRSAVCDAIQSEVHGQSMRVTAIFQPKPFCIC